MMIARSPRSLPAATAEQWGHWPVRSSLCRLAALLLVVVASSIGAAPASAVQPDEILADQALEARARAISAGLRCLVCQNQSIDDSDAPLARDLRLIVRERLTAGDTDGEVVDFVVARYGQFVLLKPPFEPETLILWLTPLAVLGLAGFIVWRGLRRSAATPGRGSSGDGTAALTDEEKRRLDELIGRG